MLPPDVQVALDAVREDGLVVVEHDGGVCVCVLAGVETRRVTRELLDGACFNRIRAGVRRWAPAPAQALLSAPGGPPRNVWLASGTTAERPDVASVVEGTFWHDTATNEIYIAVNARDLPCGCAAWRRISGLGG